MDTIDLIQGVFPKLKDAPWEVTSDSDKHYNCIAWAVGITTEWWWPSTKSVWPTGVPMELTIEAFVAALATKGYEPCDRADLETGIEKIALYARGNLPTHAARQLASGKWTSKLGRNYDIQHSTPEAVAGALYGSVVLHLKRDKG